MNEVTVQRELLGRILDSPQFAPADSLRRILRYLFDRSQEPGGESPKEYEIAVQALHRGGSFDPKTDPIIRVNMAAIRARLQAYFEEVGRNEPLQLLIPKRQYRLCFVERGPRNGGAERVRGGLETCEKFWKPYLSGRVPNTLIYSELLFFRDNRGTYARSIYVNDRATGIEQMKERFPEVPVADFRPSFHFVSAGVMRALLALEGAFRDMGAPLRIRDSRFFTWSDVQGPNLIVLGSSRTNLFLDSLQGNEAFVITAECIRNVAPQPGEEPTYRGQPFLDGKLERLVEYAVVTRRPALVGNNSITLIAANHGRAIEGAGLFLSCEDKVGSLLEAMGQNPHSALPPHFQILLRIDMIDFDEEVVSVEYVTHRVLR